MILSHSLQNNMMTSSNGNIFRATGYLCGEFTGHQLIPPTKASFDVFFDLRLNKRLTKQPWGWWIEAPTWSLWRHYCVNTEMLTAPSLTWQAIVTTMIFSPLNTNYVVGNIVAYENKTHHVKLIQMSW